METVRLANRHASSCDDCSARREARLDPASSSPPFSIAVAPIALKAKAAAALEAEGVPMAGSVHGSSGGRRGTAGQSGRALAPPRHGAGVVVLVVALVTVATAARLEKQDGR